MNKVKAFLMTVVMVLVVALMSSCANTNLTKGQQGAVGGAAGGAVIGQAIGRNTEATLIGAAVGTLFGYIFGNEMDKYDRQQLNMAYETGPSNQPVEWVNPDSGAQYQVVPEPAYTERRSQRICRPAEILAVIGGKAERTMTTACRTDSGQWQIQ